MDHKKVLVKTTLISLLVFIGFNYIVGLPVARAETRTVCDSGCDYTTFADAHTAAGSGDVISIITDNINFGGFPNIIKINKNYKEKLEFKKKENIDIDNKNILSISDIINIKKK